ncbi:hypothetical protein L7F22_005809 [Adiantum nelumboides]|nr:hypothetical protein [Adiantum nelumboides]
MNLSELDKDWASFLNGFSDCFLDSLPDKLPPERPEDHGMDIVPSFSLPNRPPHRVSAAQQKEIMRQGSLAYKVLLEDNIKTCNKGITREYQFSDSSVVASTLLGSVVVFVRLTREEYELLDAVQNRLALYPLTSPLLGNNHAKFRGRGCPAGAYKVLDGDMLGQFLELTSSQQRSVLADQPGSESLSTHNSNLNWSSRGVLSVEEVLRLLDLVQNSLT